MSGSVSFRWDVPPGVLAKAVGDYGQRLLAAVFELAQVFAARIESYAKANAPWTDRTTVARTGLTGRAFKTATGVVIILFHAASYGIWLEIAHSGRWAIILRSLEAHYGPLMAAIRSLVGG